MGDGRTAAAEGESVALAVRRASGIRTGWRSRFVPHTGIAWKHLSQELGFSSGMTCCRRLSEGTEAGVRPRLHEVLLAELRRANVPDFSTAAVDGFPSGR